MGFKKASDFEGEDKAKVLIHGNSGSGKSSLGATAKQPIIALCERQALRSIRRINPDADIWMIEEMNDLRNLVEELIKRSNVDDMPWDTLVLDSLTEIQLVLQQEVLNKTERDGLTLNEWGIIIDKTQNIVRTIRDLPINVLVLARSDEYWVDDTRHVRPSLSGKKLPNSIAGFFNVVGYQYKKQADAGQIIYRTLFEGVETIMTKADPSLDSAEVSYWPLWLRKMYGAEAKGAASDKEIAPKYLQEISSRNRDGEALEEKEEKQSKTKKKNKG